MTDIYKIISSEKKRKLLMVFLKMEVVWFNLLKKIGIHPEEIRRSLRELEKSEVIISAKDHPKTSIYRNMLLQKIKTPSAIKRIKFYTLNPSYQNKLKILLEDELKNFDFDFLKAYEDAYQKELKGTHITKVGTCSVCGKPIELVQFFDEDKISEYGNLSINGRKLPINGKDKPWEWVCSSCIKTDSNLKKLSEFVLHYKLQEENYEI